MQRRKNLSNFSSSIKNSMLDAESLLLERLEEESLDSLFYKQKMIGNHTVDLYCPDSNLIIEIDGGQHFTNEGKIENQIRDAYLKKMGFIILRFSDVDIFTNVDGVVKLIKANCEIEIE